jgi:hypothetical protein
MGGRCCCEAAHATAFLAMAASSQEATAAWERTTFFVKEVETRVSHPEILISKCEPFFPQETKEFLKELIYFNLK